MPDCFGDGIWSGGFNQYAVFAITYGICSAPLFACDYGNSGRRSFYVYNSKTLNITRGCFGCKYEQIGIPVAL